jgi:hypothetical protein
VVLFTIAIFAQGAEVEIRDRIGDVHRSRYLPLFVLPQVTRLMDTISYTYDDLHAEQVGLMFY